MPADDSNSDGLPPMNTEEKSATFRKRRLSCPRHHLEAAVAAVQEEEDEVVSNEDSKEQNPEEKGEEKSDDKAQTFRKRRLSLNLSKSQDDSEDGHRPAKRRRSSVASTTSASSSTANQPLKRHKSLTLHSTELLGGPLPPPSPAVHNNDMLYRQQPAPPPALALGPPGLEAVEHLPKHEQRRLLNPKWKKRHQPTDESKFPFSKDVVGTYSCHGVEPIYESDYDSHEIESGEEDSPLETPENVIIELSESVAPTKATMAAKINQDRGGIVYPYGNSRKTALFAVYDGHGQGGELVSQYALHEIQRRLERHSTFSSDLERSFRETFIAVDDSLRHEPIIDPYYAGTTAVVALLRDQKLTLANAGDSRAVLAQRTGDSWTALDLTEDQNPDSPGEQARIESMGGYVSAPPEPGLSSRVWLDSDLTQIGLAMARSIGDHAIGEVGVIADPVVTERVLEPRDDFMILASDGVWEFLSSQDAVNIVGEHLEERGATKACQALIEAAAARWHDEEGEYRDDITAIVVRLPGIWDKLAASSKT